MLDSDLDLENNTSKAKQLLDEGFRVSLWLATNDSRLDFYHAEKDEYYFMWLGSIREIREAFETLGLDLEVVRINGD